MLAEGITLQRIKFVYQETTEEIGPHPFARCTLATLNGSGRPAIVKCGKILRALRSEFDYGPSGMAREWRPRKRVYVRPTRQFGSPSVARGVPTHLIHGTYKAERGELSHKAAIDRVA